MWLQRWGSGPADTGPVFESQQCKNEEEGGEGKEVGGAVKGEEKEEGRKKMQRMMTL